MLRFEFLPIFRAFCACVLLLCVACGLRAQATPVPTVGTAAADFSVSVAVPPAQVQRGDSVTLTAIVGSLGGFAGPVTLSTQGTLPSGVAVTFSPSVVTPISPKPTWPGTISSDITIDTGTVVNATVSKALPAPDRSHGVAMCGAMLCLGLLGWRRRGLRPLLVLAALAVMLPGLQGCGLGILPPQSPGGAYTINVLATASTGQQHVVPLLVRVSD